MRKTLLILLAGIFLLCGSVEARTVRLVDDDGVEMDGRIWDTYIIDNAINDWTETQISTSTIQVNNHKILGFKVLPTHGAVGSGSEVVAGLHDTTSIAGEKVSNLKMIDEAEAESGQITAGGWFAHARKIATQLTVMQGPWTRVIIYYTE